MVAVWTFFRALKCRWGWCGGDVVSGWHDGTLWTGWKCRTCGAVKHYAPTKEKWGK